jgi:hypothetical protein
LIVRELEYGRLEDALARPSQFSGLYFIAQQHKRRLSCLLSEAATIDWADVTRPKGAVEKEEEIMIDHVVRVGQPRELWERHVVIHSGAAVVVQDLLIDKGDGEVRIVDVRDPVAVADELQVAILALDPQTRVAAVQAVGIPKNCGLVIEIERVADVDSAAAVILQGDAEAAQAAPAGGVFAKQPWVAKSGEADLLLCCTAPLIRSKVARLNKSTRFSENVVWP